jgi:hypothetical protein
LEFPNPSPSCFTKGKFATTDEGPERNQGLPRLIILSQKEPMKCGYARVSTDDQSAALRGSPL